MTTTAQTQTIPTQGAHLYVIDRGRAWVESVDASARKVTVRFDCGEGTRSRCHTFSFAQVDVTREWRF